MLAEEYILIFMSLLATIRAERDEDAIKHEQNKEAKQREWLKKKDWIDVTAANKRS